MEELLLDRKRGLSWTVRLELARDIARGMGYLHSRGVIHRDLTSKVQPTLSVASYSSLASFKSRAIREYPDYRKQGVKVIKMQGRLGSFLRIRPVTKKTDCNHKSDYWDIPVQFVLDVL